MNTRESNQIVAAVRITAARSANWLTATEGFYAQHLGGRQQTDVTPDAAARLTQITVDPATVSANPLPL